MVARVVAPRLMGAQAAVVPLLMGAGRRRRRVGRVGDQVGMAVGRGPAADGLAMIGRGEGEEGQRAVGDAGGGGRRSTGSGRGGGATAASGALLGGWRWAPGRAPRRGRRMPRRGRRMPRRVLWRWPAGRRPDGGPGRPTPGAPEGGAAGGKPPGWRRAPGRRRGPLRPAARAAHMGWGRAAEVARRRAAEAEGATGSWGSRGRSGWRGPWLLVGAPGPRLLVGSARGPGRTRQVGRWPKGRRPMGGRRRWRPAGHGARRGGEPGVLGWRGGG